MEDDYFKNSVIEIADEITKICDIDYLTTDFQKGMISEILPKTLKEKLKIDENSPPPSCEEYYEKIEKEDEKEEDEVKYLQKKWDKLYKYLSEMSELNKTFVMETKGYITTRRTEVKRPRLIHKTEGEIEEFLRSIYYSFIPCSKLLFELKKTIDEKEVKNYYKNFFYKGRQYDPHFGSFPPGIPINISEIVSTKIKDFETKTSMKKNGVEPRKYLNTNCELKYAPNDYSKVVDGKAKGQTWSDFINIFSRIFNDEKVILINDVIDLYTLDIDGDKIIYNKFNPIKLKNYLRDIIKLIKGDKLELIIIPLRIATKFGGHEVGHANLLVFEKNNGKWRGLRYDPVGESAPYDIDGKLSKQVDLNFEKDFKEFFGEDFTFDKTRWNGPQHIAREKRTNELKKRHPNWGNLTQDERKKFTKELEKEWLKRRFGNEFAAQTEAGYCNIWVIWSLETFLINKYFLRYEKSNKKTLYIDFFKAVGRNFDDKTCTCDINEFIVSYYYPILQYMRIKSKNDTYRLEEIYIDYLVRTINTRYDNILQVDLYTTLNFSDNSLKILFSTRKNTFGI